MAVDIPALNSDLEEYGEIQFCDINNNTNFIVVITGVDQEFYQEIYNIIDVAVTSDYPVIQNFDLQEGVLKVECLKEAPAF